MPSVVKLKVICTAADRINAPSKHFTLTLGDRELVAQNVIIIVQINTHIMTVILRYCGPFYDVPKHVYEVPKLRAFSRTSENPAQISGRIGEKCCANWFYCSDRENGPRKLKILVQVASCWISNWVTAPRL